MNNVLVYVVAAVLVLHGLVHLLGTAAYLELVTIAELPYKTTVLGGRVDIGDAGIRIFGTLWSVAAVGFVLSGVGLLSGWNRWRSLLLGVTVFSLVLTLLDWESAFAGVVVNLGILAALWLSQSL